MSLNESIQKHKESSIHEAPNGYDLKFRFLEQTKEVVTDRHLKTLFETGDKPNGVDFELLINSKAHVTDVSGAINELADKVSQDVYDVNEKLNQEIESVTNKINEEIANVYLELDNVDEALTEEILEHTNNAEIHLSDLDKEGIAKIPTLEQSIIDINTIIGGVSRQHIVSNIAERDLLENLIQADICHVIETKETYMYVLASNEWIKVSDFDSLATVDWSIIQNIPSEFNPVSHNHNITDVEGLREALEGAMGGDLTNYVKREELDVYALKESLEEFVQKDSLNDYALKESLDNYVVKDEDIVIPSGKKFIAGEFGSDEETLYTSRLTVEDVNYEARFGATVDSEGIPTASLGLHNADLTEDDIVNQVYFTKDAFFPITVGLTDLGTKVNTWREGHIDNVECKSLKIDGVKLSISSEEPANPSVGDIWITI